MITFVVMQMEAFEYEKQFENDQVSVTKTKIFPNEKGEFYHNCYPQIVIGLKGGTLTFLEGEKFLKKIELLADKPTYMEAQLENKFYKIVNHSSETIEFLTIQLKKSLGIDQLSKDGFYEVLFGAKLKCLMSVELKEFAKSIPLSGNYSSATFEEWKNSFVNTMTQLIYLVESENIFDSFWFAQADEILMQEIKKE